MSNNYIDDLFDNLRRDPFKTDPTNQTSYELQKDFLDDPQGPEGWVADGVIGDSQLIDGSTLVGKVDTLPTLPDPNGDYPEGKVVYLTTNGKLYRNDSDVWTAAVAAVDLTGQITGTQITDDAITTPKIAANAVVADKIASNAITTDKLNANSVTAAKIAVGTITATEIAANTITAAKIVAGTITATEIANSTITGGKIASATITGGNISNTTITASNIVDATITGAKISNATITDANIASLNADKITAGQLTLTPMSATAITSTNFTVTNTGAVTARDLTLIPATSEPQGIDAAAGAITLEPPTAFGAVILKVTNSDGTGDFDTIGFTSSAGAAANAPATVVTDTVHNFKVGQMVSFHSVGTTWNDITATAPIQIITTPTTTSFTVEHFAILPAIASNSAGTIRAYKRLAVRAAGGLYVYRDATNAGDIAAGSLVLGNNLASYGKDSLATVADGELAFIKSATPRYGSGANLYSKNGTTNVSTSGSFDVAGEIGVRGDINIGVSDTSTAGALVFKGGNGGSIRAFSATAGNDSIGIYNTAGTAGGFLVAENFYPGSQGSSFMGHNGNFTFNDSVDVTGAISATGQINAGTTLTGGALTCDAITGTTATTNAAIWVLLSGTNYALRRNTSSARYKTNIIDADEAVLEAARKIKPRHYESTIADEAGTTRLGFIAEEIEAAGLTHAIGYDAEGQVETIDPTALIAALWHRVNDLENRLKTLEGNVA